MGGRLPSAERWLYRFSSRSRIDENTNTWRNGLYQKWFCVLSRIFMISETCAEEDGKSRIRKDQRRLQLDGKQHTTEWKSYKLHKSQQFYRKSEAIIEALGCTTYRVHSIWRRRSSYTPFHVVKRVCRDKSGERMNSWRDRGLLASLLVMWTWAYSIALRFQSSIVF